MIFRKVHWLFNHIQRLKVYFIPLHSPHVSALNCARWLTVPFLLLTCSVLRLFTPSSPCGSSSISSPPSLTFNRSYSSFAVCTFASFFSPCLFDLLGFLKKCFSATNFFFFFKSNAYCTFLSFVQFIWNPRHVKRKKFCDTQYWRPDWKKIPFLLFVWCNIN